MKLNLFIILVVVIELVVSNHLIVIGDDSWASHASGDKAEECTADTSTKGVASNSNGNEIGVQCCSADGTSGSRQNLKGGINYNGYHNCLKGVSYNRAKTACETNGDRLCTAHEVRNNIGSGSGCSHDKNHVWTADPCGAHWIVIGRSAHGDHSSGSKEEECTDDSSTQGIASNSYGSDIGVQCCDDIKVTQSMPWPLKDITFTETKGYRQYLDGNGCLQGVDYDAAKQACDAEGYRLCTVEEVEDDIGAGSGCSHDYRHVWTSNTCDENGLDSYFAERYAPYLRFDSGASSGVNGFPTTYNYPNGQKSQQNMNSGISKIPTYYHVYHDTSGNVVSIGYFWYYEFQTACIYDGITGLDQLPGDLENAITSVIDDLDIMYPAGLGEHDNDVEKIFINLNSDYSLKSVTYHQHDGKYTMTPNKITMYSSTHPTVYIGRTSHGSYHNKITSPGGCGYFHDYRSGSIQRKSWDNLKKAYFKGPGVTRESGWNSNSFCGSTGCNWASCETSSEINSNPDKCTPLDCNYWKTSCLPWGVSDAVQAAYSDANIKDKYFWLYDSGDPDCGCTSIPLIGNVCTGEHIEGQVCTPNFAETYPMIPNGEIPIIDNKPKKHYINGKEDKYITFTISIWYFLIIGLTVILLSCNCLKTIYSKCIKNINNKRKNIIYKSVKMDSETEEVDDEYMA